jgi:hypothetical protein
MDNEPAPKTSDVPRLLTFVAGNFAAFSALGLVAVILCSTIFLYGYLSVFDWRLIWIIEYPDIFKFGLVAIAAISGAIAFIQAVIQNFFTVKKLEGRERWAHIVIISVFAIIALAAIIYFDRRSESPIPYTLYLSFAVSGFFLIVLCFIVADIASNRWPLNAERAFIVFIIVILGVASFGGTFGTYTKYGQGLHYDVFLKDREMNDVRLVLFTSHHAVLYSGNLVTVLPTSEIMRIVAHPAGTAKQ